MRFRGRRAPPSLPLPDTGTVTALTPDGPQGERVVVEVDHVAWPAIGPDAAVQLALHVGQVLDADGLAALQRAGAARAAMECALRLLAAHARSVADLRQALKDRDVDPDAAEHAIARCLALGYLNDVQFADTFVRYRATTSGWSRGRLQAELGRHGIRGEIATQALAALRDDASVDLAAIRDQVAARRWHALRDVPAPVRRRRWWAFLARRGYSPDDIQAALAVLTRQAEESEDAEGADPTDGAGMDLAMDETPDA